MTKRHRMFRTAAALSILVCLTAARHLGTAVAALFNENNAVHVDPDTIESTTLIIGTHLIYLHALNEEIYAAAMDSASLSGQDRRFYKSELAGGMWVEITDAGSVRDITAAGNIVDKSEIQALFLTHHTKSDRVTYDLRTSAKVCIFDIYNVYDLESMPELEPLKLQYDMMKESGSRTKTIKRNKSLVQQFFAMPVKSETTALYDRQIQALQGYYDELAANGAESRDCEMVLYVMAKVDNSRKAAVYTLIESGLASLQGKVTDVSGNADLELDDVLLTAIGNSQNALAESMSEAQGNMLARGDTVLSETEYTLSEEMITNAISDNYFACDGQNRKLQHLQNISAGVIADRMGETELLNAMIDRADVVYGQMLSRGATNEYMTLASQNVSHAALQSRMKADMADANAARGELEFFIQGKADRMGREEAQGYILTRIQDAAKFKAAVRTDAYRTEYRNSVTAYVDWLNALLDSSRKSGSSQTEEEGMALARAFGKLEQAFLPMCYSAGVLVEERLFVLPPMHRFGWYCAQAFGALEGGGAAEYVRLLRTGLDTCKDMKPMVECLADHTAEVQRLLTTPELRALAEQVRVILVRFSPNDPAVAALKQSEAYQKVAHLIEGTAAPVWGGLPQ